MADLAHTRGAKAGFGRREYAQRPEIRRIFPNDNYSRLKESWLLFWSGKTSACNGRLNGAFALEKG